jgi:thymidine kinase
MGTKKPTLTIYTGPMWGGKTARLLADLDRITRQGKKIVVFKPKMDYRYTQEEIVSHSGMRWPAYCVSSGEEIIKHLFGLDEVPDVIAVDEAFMIAGVSDTLVSLFRMGKDVIVSSIEMSATCAPFEEMTKLFPWATSVVKCPAVCVMCKEDAYYSYAKITLQDDVTVGGDELYEPRCWNCHPSVCTFD